MVASAGTADLQAGRGVTHNLFVTGLRAGGTKVNLVGMALPGRLAVCFTQWSVLDEARDIRGHPAGAHPRDVHVGTGVRRFKHHALTEIERFVLTRIGPVEDDVTATHLR